VEEQIYMVLSRKHALGHEKGTQIQVGSNAIIPIYAFNKIFRLNFVRELNRKMCFGQIEIGINLRYGWVQDK
jgi:hypothetical protein